MAYSKWQKLKNKHTHMKKHLLVGVLLGIGCFANAQNSSQQAGKIGPKLKPEIANQAVPFNKHRTENNPSSFQAIVNANNAQNKKNRVADASRAFTSTVIGTTIYDLQTNASVCNRIILNADSTIAATWSMSHDTDPEASPNRGTGYNYFDGTSWDSLPTNRIESIRCGWPNIGVTATNGEVIVSHEATSGTGNIHVLTRPVKGTGLWHDTTLNYPDVWSRMVVGGTNGKTIHIISQTTGASTSGNPPFHGQDGAVAYSRSTDGGLTWDKYHSVIPEIDSSHYKGFGGDSYAIDTKGDTIAIVVGGFTVDVVLLKSIDNGNTWTKTIVNAFPIPLYDETSMSTDINNDGNADTIETNDASVSVLLDNQGKAHVWYGRMRVTEDLGATNVSYFPGTDGLYYWNETMTEPGIIAFAQDINDNGTLDVANFGTYQVSLTSMPNAGIDKDGKIYLVYGSIYEGIAEEGTVGGGKSFRHTYIMRSSDGGLTWCGPFDIVDPDNSDQYDYMEGVFGAITRRIDDNAHIIYQNDHKPGHALSSNNVDPQEPGYESEIIYVKFPASDFDPITTCDSLFFDLATLGIKENKESITNLSIYPNPASNLVNMAFTLNQPEKVNIKIFNAIGQELSSRNENFVTGNNNVSINLNNYKPGLYFVKSTYKNKVITKKLVVE